MANASTWLIKVMSGPNFGAEASLGDGEFTVGSSQECDIILTDALVAPRHLQLSIRQGSVKWKRQAEPVFLNGKPADDQEHDLEPYQCLTLGGTHLVLGPENGTWPALPILDLIPYKNGTHHAAESSKEEKNEALPETTAKVEKAGGVQRKKQELPKFDKQVILRIIAGVLLGAGILVAVLTLLPFHKEQKQPTLSERVAAISDKLSVELRGDRYVVTGYVDTSAEKRAILKSLRDFQGQVILRVWSKEDLISDAKVLLRTLGIQAAITSPKPGVLRIRGFVPTMEHWERAAGNLKQDVPGVQDVEVDHITTYGELQEVVGSVLNELNLNNIVKVTLDNGVLVAKGSLNSTDADAWKNFPKLIEQRLGFKLEIKDQVHTPFKKIEQGAAISPEEPEKITEGDNRVAGIVEGELSWITLRDGRKLFVGAILPNGYIVESIANSKIVLKRNNEQQTVSIGEELWPKQ